MQGCTQPSLQVKARDVGGDEYLRALFYTGDKKNVSGNAVPKIFEGLVENTEEVAHMRAG